MTVGESTDKLIRDNELLLAFFGTVGLLTLISVISGGRARVYRYRYNLLIGVPVLLYASKSSYDGLQELYEIRDELG